MLRDTNDEHQLGPNSYHNDLARVTVGQCIMDGHIGSVEMAGAGFSKALSIYACYQKAS